MLRMPPPFEKGGQEQPFYLGNILTAECAEECAENTEISIGTECTVFSTRYLNSLAGMGAE